MKKLLSLLSALTIMMVPVSAAGAMNQYEKPNNNYFNTFLPEEINYGKSSVSFIVPVITGTENTNLTLNARISYLVGKLLVNDQEKVALEQKLQQFGLQFFNLQQVKAGLESQITSEKEQSAKLQLEFTF